MLYKKRTPRTTPHGKERKNPVLLGMSKSWYEWDMEYWGEPRPLCSPLFPSRWWKFKRWVRNLIHRKRKRSNQRMPDIDELFYQPIPIADDGKPETPPEIGWVEIPTYNGIDRR